MTYEIDQMDGEVDCYTCGGTIPDGSTNWGYSWGSDGVWPDGASAMYSCWDCRDEWVDWCRDAATKDLNIAASAI